MSHELLKKSEGGEDYAAARPEQSVALESQSMMAVLKGQMDCMQSEMTLHRQRIASLNAEVEGMKERISHADGLEEKCHFLEVRCGALERIVQSLVRNNDLEYSPPVPTSNWTELGFDNDYYEEFLSDLKSKSCELLRGKPNLHALCEYFPDEEEVVPHDENVINHWRSFADALLFYGPAEVSGPVGVSGYYKNPFSFQYVQLSSSVLKMLSPIVAMKNFREFHLVKNEFINIRDGIQFAIDAMESTPNMKWFGWEKNPVDDMDDVNDLVEAICIHPSIEDIYLSGAISNANGYSVLCSIIGRKSNALFIDLGSNNIRTEGRMHLPNFLATNPPLREIILVGNHFDDNDAILIANSLKQNTNLKKLVLDDNEITSAGRDALRKAVFDSTSLNSISDSNHSCCVEGLWIEVNENNFSDPYGKFYVDWRENRGVKIFFMLTNRNRDGTNTHYMDLELGEDSLSLVPRILECVYNYFNYYSNIQMSFNGVKPLSIIYELIRFWKISELIGT